MTQKLTDDAMGGIHQRRQCDNQTEKWYRAEMLPNVRKQIIEFKAECADDEWALRGKVIYLLQRWHTMANSCEWFAAEVKGGKGWWQAFCKSHCERLLKEMDKLERRISYQMGRLNGKPVSENGVTDAMIERARAYPIEQLVDVGRNGMARCVFHDDKNPSMRVYADNHAHCFVCSFHGDAILVFMKLNNRGFLEAVRRMQ